MKALPVIMQVDGHEFIDKLKGAGTSTVHGTVELNGNRYTILMFGDEKANIIYILNTVAAVNLHEAAVLL